MNANGNQNVNFSISLSPSIEQINLSYALWQVGTNNWDWATFNISMYNYSDSSWVSLYNTTITWPGENCQVTKFPLKIDSDFRNGNIVNISLRMKEYDSSPGAVAYTTGTYSCDGESVSFTNKGHSFVWSRIYLYRGNTQFCGILEDGGPSCQLNWTVNATGDTLPQVRAIDVNFSSSMAAVSPADTANAYVKIVSLNPPSYEYTILMPSGYTCPEDCFVITAPSETEANKTDWITFNTSDTASDVQPWRGGIQTNAQSGLKKPIILVKNTGSVKINLTIRLNESLPSGSALYYYSTCVYPCTGRVKEQMTTNYQTVIKGLSPGGYANITLWLDTSNAPFGTYIRKVFINATAT